MAKRRRDTDIDRSPLNLPAEPAAAKPVDPTAHVSVTPPAARAEQASRPHQGEPVKPADFGQLPNLSLDEPEPADAEEVIDLAEIEEEPFHAELIADEDVVALDEPGSQVVAAELVESVDDDDSPIEAAVIDDDEAPGSEILAAELVESVEEVSDAEMVEEDSDVLAGELVEPTDDEVAAELLSESAVLSPASDVVAAEPASQHSSDVFSAEFAEPERTGSSSAVVAAEPSAALAAEPIDSAVFVRTDSNAEALAAAEPMSDVFAGDFLRDMEADGTAKKEPSGIFSDVALQEGSAVQDAEEEAIVEEPASAIVEADEADIDESALHDDEVIAVEPVSAAVEADSAEETPVAAVSDEELVDDVVFFDDDEIDAESASAVAEADVVDETPVGAEPAEEHIGEAALAEEVPAAAVVEAESLDETPMSVAEPIGEAALAEEVPAAAVVEAESLDELPVAAVLDEEPIADAVLSDDEVPAAESASAIAEADVVEETPLAAEPVAEPIDEAFSDGKPASGVIASIDEPIGLDETPIAAEFHEEAIGEAAFADEHTASAVVAEPMLEETPLAESIPSESTSAIAAADVGSLDVAVSPAEMHVGEPSAAAVPETASAEVGLFPDMPLSQDEPKPLGELAADDERMTTETPAAQGLDAALFPEESLEPAAVAPVELAGVDAALFPDDPLAGIAGDAETKPSSSEVLGDEAPIAAEPASAIVSAKDDDVLHEEVAESVSAVSALEEAEIAEEAIADADAVAESAESALADDAVESAEPASAIAALEEEAIFLEDEEVVSAEPSSAIAVADEITEGVFEEEEPAIAEAESAVMAAEEADVEEAIEEASSAIEALDDEELIADEAGSVAEAEEAPSSAVLAAEEADEVEEAVAAEPSSAIKILDDEDLVAAEAASAVVGSDAVEADGLEWDDPSMELEDRRRANDETIGLDDSAPPVRHDVSDDTEAMDTFDFVDEHAAAGQKNEEASAVIDPWSVDELVESPSNVSEIEEAAEVAEEAEDAVAEEEPAEVAEEAEEAVAEEEPAEVAEESEEAVAEEEAAEVAEEAEEAVAEEEAAEVAEEAEEALAEEAEEALAEEVVAEEVEEAVAEEEVAEEAEEAVAEEVAEEADEAAIEDELAAQEVAEEADEEATVAEDAEDVAAAAFLEDEVAPPAYFDDEIAEADEVLEEPKVELPPKRGKQTQRFAQEEIFGIGELNLELGELPPDSTDKPRKKSRLLDEAEEVQEVEEVFEADEAPAPKKKPGKLPAKPAGDWPAPKTRAKPAKKSFDVSDDSLITMPIQEDGGMLNDSLITQPIVDDELDGGEVLVTEPIDGDPYDDGGVMVTEALDDEEFYGDHQVVVSGGWDDGQSQLDDGQVVVRERRTKPKYARRWLGGMLLGWFLAAGTAVGLWYFAPDIVNQALKEIPDSPNAKAQPKPEEQEKTEALPPGFVIPKEGPDVAQLKTVSEKYAVLAKVMKELDGKLKALGVDKMLDENNRVDLAKLEKKLQEGAQDRATLDLVNKELAIKELAADDSAEGKAKAIVKLYQGLSTELAKVNKILADSAKVEGEGLKGVENLIALRDKLQQDRDELDGVVKSALKELTDARALKEGAQARGDVMEGIKNIRAKSESPLGQSLAQLVSSVSGVGAGSAQYLDKALENAALVAKIKFYQGREEFLASPADKLEFNLKLLRNRTAKDPADLLAAQNLAQWLLNPQAESTVEVKAKAQYVLGLAYRNEHKFDESRKALQAAIAEAENVKNVDVLKGKDLSKEFSDSLRELTDPMFYFMPRIQRLQEVGRLSAALDELNLALQAIPGDARLLARRSLVRFEAERSASTFIPGKVPEKVQEAIRADAGQAGKDPIARIEGTFVMGMLEEEIGNLKGAEDFYREALQLHEVRKQQKASSDDSAQIAMEGARIRIALGRLLQRDRTPAGQALPQSRLDNQPGDVQPVTATDEPDEPACEPNYHPLTALLAAAVITQQQFDDDEDPAVAKRINESLAIAEELIGSDNPKIKGSGYMMKGLALAKKGRRTDGLRVYVDGLKLAYPGKDTAELVKLIEEHPIFQQPDVTTRPDKGLAEYHYNMGRQFYFAKKYAEAEAHFKQSVTYFDQDARTLYFFGLSQLAQNTRIKRDAADFSFIKAGKLEAKGFPAFNSYVEVNLALERIQGEVRQHLNRYRKGGINTVN
jgi:hypothetical protein